MDGARRHVGVVTGVSSAPKTGLYVHWPYCAKICPYCDFNVVKNRDIDMDRWRTVLLQDLHHWREVVGPRDLVSLYLGGGTPSLMPPSLVADLVDAASSVFGFVDNPEVTLEANPTDIETSRLKDFAAAGVNRLSLGIQSFDDEQLWFLGRNHSGADARHAVAVAQLHFEKLTVDLIYALPDETPESWAGRLTDICERGVQHLSLYQLTIEPGTAFYNAVERKSWLPAPDDRQADLFELTQEITAAHGLPAYEVSNHAAPGHEAIHNALYWQAADWIGLGPGAHGRLTVSEGRLATEGTKAIGAYLKGVDANARYASEPLTPEDMLIEQLAGGLRQVSGIGLAQLPDHVGLAAQPLVDQGLLEIDRGSVRVPQCHRLVLDHIVLELINAF